MLDLEVELVAEVRRLLRQDAVAEEAEDRRVLALELQLELGVELLEIVDVGHRQLRQKGSARRPGPCYRSRAGYWQIAEARGVERRLPGRAPPAADRAPDGRPAGRAPASSSGRAARAKRRSARRGCGICRAGSSDSSPAVQQEVAVGSPRGRSGTRPGRGPASRSCAWTSASRGGRRVERRSRRRAAALRKAGWSATFARFRRLVDRAHGPGSTRWPAPASGATPGPPRGGGPAARPRFAPSPTNAVAHRGTVSRRHQRSAHPSTRDGRLGARAHARACAAPTSRVPAPSRARASRSRRDLVRATARREQPEHLALAARDAARVERLARAVVGPRARRAAGGSAPATSTGSPRAAACSASASRRGEPHRSDEASLRPALERRAQRRSGDRTRRAGERHERRGRRGERARAARARRRAARSRSTSATRGARTACRRARPPTRVAVACARDDEHPFAGETRCERIARRAHRRATTSHDQAARRVHASATRPACRQFASPSTARRRHAARSGTRPARPGAPTRERA